MEDFITENNQKDAGARSHDSLKKQLITLENTYGAKNYHPLDVVIAKGNGIWLWDTNGKKYLDCLSGYSAVNQGHCHPKIVETIVRQSQQLTLTSRAFRNDQLGPFYQELCTLTRSHLALPMNSGSEAVESCIKAVRKWGYTSKGVPDNQAEIIVCNNNFHGRTVTIVGFSSDEGYRKSFGPFTPGFVRIPFGDSKALESAITPNTVAFLVEPIQGEAGIIVPPKGYLKEVREICTRNNVILITDEIQTGLGRTGAMLAEEHEGIEADLTLLGKALSGGFYPVSAVLSNEHVLGVFEPGEHGSTFGGNPLACAIARTAIRLLQEEGMIENAKVLGAYALETLSAITGNKVKEVRGKGLMIGIEMYSELGGARRFSEQLCNAGILCKETHDHTLRFAPPLIITKQDLDWALETIISILS